MTAKTVAFGIIMLALSQAEYELLIDSDFSSTEDKVLALFDMLQIKATYLDNDFISYLTDADWEAVEGLIDDEIKEREEHQNLIHEDLEEQNK